MKLSELCHQIIALVEKMRTLAAEEEWETFWVLDKQRIELCDALQNGRHTPADFRACRHDLEVLLQKNSALQEDIVEIRQQYQEQLVARRQQRQVAGVYAQQGARG